MEEPSPQRAYQGEGYAAVRFGGRNDSRENRRKMNTKDTRNTTAGREMKPDQIMILNISGRGDKDMQQIAEYRGVKIDD